MSDFERINMFVQLDALLDTRLATLHKLNPDGVKEALVEGYATRIVDSFKGYERTAFDEAYAARDEVILKQAFLCPSHMYLNYFIDRTLAALVTSPLRRQPKIVVNTFPYRIDEEASREMVKALVHLTQGRADIEMVHLSMENVTPRMLSRDYAIVMMYDYWNWFEIHALNENLKHTRIPNVQFFAPALIRDESVTKAFRALDIFKAIEMSYSCIAGLTLFPVSKFCVDLEQYQKTMEAN